VPDPKDYWMVDLVLAAEPDFIVTWDPHLLDHEIPRCELIYLPPYSPDFNPIEQAFSKLKSYLREPCARTQQTLMELIGEALHTITASDAEGFFKHCGYRAVVRSL
jgi:transposase